MHTNPLYSIDMVHHNPGETAFETKFTDPNELLVHGFNGQAFKHINTVATFEAVAPGVFPSNDEERIWLDAFTAERGLEIEKAKTAGLNVFYHIDLFVLPKAIFEKYKDDICDPETGLISLDKPMTLELHRAIFDEIFGRWPEIDGLIIRVGETYLMDTPHHTGNGAVTYHGPAAESVESMHAHFKKLLQFLRTEICERHNRCLIYRTWDCAMDRFHSNLEFYKEVTDAIEPHPKLIFSVKHTRNDFLRYVPINPCLMQGKHSQVIEVQCQREYDGKGAYPHYIARMVLEGFPELPNESGIASLASHPRFAGLYTWTRGGGWHGPYVDSTNEFWCELNFAVLASWLQDPSLPESEHFAKVCKQHYQMPNEDCAVLREIALGSEHAVLIGKQCTDYDEQTDRVMQYPTNVWNRDDVLHGYDALDVVFEKLIELSALDSALKEKANAVEEWKSLRSKCDLFSGAMPTKLRDVITTTTEYGLRFFTVIEAAWRVLGLGYAMRNNSTGATTAQIQCAIRDFDQSWAHFQVLPDDYPHCPTLFRGVGWHFPGAPEPDGLLDSIESVRSRFN